MPYVSRDAENKISSAYSAEQEFATEYVEDNDPELVAFIESSGPKPQTGPAPENAVLYDHENRLRVIEGTPPLTLAEFVSKTTDAPLPTPTKKKRER